MRVLLDTHAALWWLADDDRLGDAAASAVADRSNEVLLSAVVVWEVAIKRSLGKLDAPDGFAETLLGAGATPLGISLEHASEVEDLPWHHRDPFDRLLLAQARIEHATVVLSSDERFSAYGVDLIW